MLILLLSFIFEIECFCLLGIVFNINKTGLLLLMLVFVLKKDEVVNVFPK